MKGCLASLLLFCASVVAASGATFDEANQLYDQGRFREAKTAYESLRDAGQGSANLFYNLGNAEFRLADTGRAALQYERALLLEPAHPEARANLDLVHRQTAALVTPPTAAERAVLPLSNTAYTMFAMLAGWALAGALVGLYGFRRRDSFALWATAIVAAGVGAYSVFALSTARAQQSVAIVVDPEAVARVAAADGAAAVEPLPPSSRVEILSQRGDWTYCALPGNRRGWLPASAIESLLPRSS